MNYDIDSEQKVVDEAINCLDRFFSGRKMHSGEIISRNLYLSKFCIKITLDTKLDDEWQYCVHEAIDAIPHDSHENIRLKWSVHKLIQILTEIASFNIPKVYQAGICLLYLNFCEGVEIPYMHKI